jgi:hypothetical protein
MFFSVLVHGANSPLFLTQQQFQFLVQAHKFLCRAALEKFDLSGCRFIDLLQYFQYSRAQLLIFGAHGPSLGASTLHGDAQGDKFQLAATLIAQICEQTAQPCNA